MKKNDKTKRVMRLLITLMLMASLLLGCSSTEAETETAEAKPEVEEPAEVEEVEKEATKPEETETTEVETEATEEAPAEEVAEDPGEVTYITDYTSIEDYMGSLDPEKPAIVVYNAEEEYIINMQEGQYYQLKATDSILFNAENLIGYGWDDSLGSQAKSFENYSKYLIDYSKMQPKHEFFLKKLLDSGEIIQITCYFDPPADYIEITH